MSTVTSRRGASHDAPSARPPSASRRRRSLGRPQLFAAWALTIPFLIVFAAMFLVPLGYAGYLSTFTSQLVGGQVFSGLANYARALEDPSFWAGLGRVALFLFVQVPIMLVIALVIALALDTGRVAGSKFVRLAIFVPYAVPGVVATLMWGYLYGRESGLIAQMISSVGLTPPDLLSPQNVLGSTMNIVSWEFIGYNMIVLYAALRSVPTDMYEAAEIDGAGPFRVAWSIKIPAIRSAILLTVIFSVIGSFQLFNEPNLLYSIAPNAIGSDFTPNLYAYNVAFRNQDVNYAAAIAFLLGFFIMVISYVVQLATSRKERLS
ncbi:multiple sugar transport system permease protein [Labedella gwakjiensis]|uniref:Multiple sugar transport system permease protein n=1 Tax=Labedella gwakjiensis TaxID=390269 RepID=A0A2P8GTI5_9MICO|nr:sugar ABC transporter permease [Labedella gwakjiensis]PSL37274.1 multiple sugar transport system permease protein [Labedella gwakjiensis]RUQ84601.1 sugar ABC transporter permease [Labedella gwakjiensis]